MSQNPLSAVKLYLLACRLQGSRSLSDISSGAEEQRTLQEGRASKLPASRLLLLFQRQCFSRPCGNLQVWQCAVTEKSTRGFHLRRTRPRHVFHSGVLQDAPEGAEVAIDVALPVRVMLVVFRGEETLRALACMVLLCQQSTVDLVLHCIMMLSQCTQITIHRTIIICQLGPNN
mmetsp:Transcript_57679/g.153704  ORF Transcript_57679/g.153704 Transcript_57679/m.153704 type:complete len:174 (+) Transcript_57679:134-655(+)